MKTANVYEIERALQQPITPQQRQTAAANNPVAALLAQRLDGVEGSLRTKMQTPPPPQGTVMNQYYQWPQQQPNQLGLAQPGLEELAQQYAAGGLVAFADGGDVRGFSGGSGVRNLYDQLSDFSLGDINSDEAETQRLQHLPEQYRKAIERGEQLPAPPVTEQESPIGDYIASTMREKLGLHTSNEEDKLKERLAEKSAKQQAEVDAKERPGTSVLSPAAWSAGRGAGLGSMLAGYEGDNEVPRYSGLRQEGEAPVQPSTVVITEPEHREAATQITSRENGLSADQQIAELAKYFQTDTSEAMRIKGEMERDNAKANNLDIFAAMMGAIGLGIGTNAPKGQQWGAGLAGLASGLSGANKMADARQGKLDELALKIKEMEGSGIRKSAETVLSARAKSAADAAEMRKALAVANIGRQGRVEAANISAGGKGETNELHRQELRAKIIENLSKDIPAAPKSAKWNDEYNRRLQDYIAQNPWAAELLVGVGGIGGTSSSATPARSLGQFSGGSFTPYT